MNNAFKKQQTNPEFYYYRGRCAYEVGEYNLAADSFQNSFLLNNNFLRSRLEYARTLFQLKRFEESRRHLKLVLASKPPDDVRKKIEAFIAIMDALENRHELNGALVAGIKYDSNLYNRVDSKSIYIPAFDFSLSNDTTKLVDRSHYEVVNLEHAYALDFLKTSKIKTGLSLFSESKQTYFDRSIAMGFLQSGWEKRGKDWMVYLPIYFQKVGLGGENYLENYGIRPKIEWYIDRFHKVDVGFEVSKENYLDPNNINLDANIIATNLDVTKMINANNLLTASLDYRKKQKINGDRTDVDSKLYQYGLEYTYLYNKPLRFELAYDYSQTYYDQTDTLLLSKRKDDRYSWKLGIAYQLNDKMLLNSTLKKLSNHSNHVPFQYDKDIYSLQYIYLIK